VSVSSVDSIWLSQESIASKFLPDETAGPARQEPLTSGLPSLSKSATAKPERPIAFRPPGSMVSPVRNCRRPRCSARQVRCVDGQQIDATVPVEISRGGPKNDTFRGSKRRPRLQNVFAAECVLEQACSRKRVDHRINVVVAAKSATE